VSEQAYERFVKKKELIEQSLGKLEEGIIYPNQEVNQVLERLRTSPIRSPASLKQILRRPEMSWDKLRELEPSLQDLPEPVKEEVEIQVKYEGYIEREMREVERFRKREQEKIPPNFDYEQIPGLSKEVREKLKKVQPISLGQAGRIPGVTPAALSILQVFLKKFKQESAQNAA